jgi:hypothetical protein
MGSILQKSYGSIVAATHKLGFGVFLCGLFQIGLPPDWNTIILCRKVGIGPVGVRPFLQSELPPQAASCTGRGRDHA